MFRMLLCLIGAVGIGLGFGGWKSLKLRRSGDADGARKNLRRGAWCAAISSLLLMAVFLGWPWIRQTVSVVEEVAETVVVPEKEVVKLWHSFFSGKTQVVTKNVAKQITHQQSVAHQQRHFSVWLLAFEMLVASVAYCLLLWTCALLWRRLPRRFLPDN